MKIPTWTKWQIAKIPKYDIPYREHNIYTQKPSVPYREYYIKENHFGRYTNLINFLKEQTKNKKTILHIHSQGFSTDFTEFFVFKDDNFDVQLHIDDHPISDIYHMSNSDLFIMSNSSFSWITSFLNSNQIILAEVKN